MEAISRSCLPEAAARTKRQRKATCCGVLGAPSHRTTCSRSSAAKLTSGLLLAMRTHISYWPQYVYLFMIHTTSSACDLAPGGTCLGGCPTVTLLIPDRSVREAGGVFLPVRFCGRLFSKQELELIREIARDYAGLGITEIARTVCELLDWRSEEH